MLAVLLYWKVGLSWWLFLALFLVPDLSFLGYLGGPRAGPVFYNAAQALLWQILRGNEALGIPESRFQ